MNFLGKRHSFLYPDNSEKVAYNNPLFPAYSQYGILSRYPDYSDISHWHADLEFILIKKGKMTYNVNGKLIELTEGNGIMVNSRQLHYGFSPDRQECEFICILFSPDLLKINRWFYDNLVERITENITLPYFQLNRNGWQADILERLDRLHQCFGNSSDGRPLDFSCYFQALEDFLFIMRMLYKNIRLEIPYWQTESSDLISLKQMIAFMEEHYREHLVLENIASAGTCCKSRCSLLFKKYLRSTPIAYLTKFRLRKSLTPLLGTNPNVTDIAFRCGFSSASYYCEIFRKYCGMSPLSYRKLYADPIENPIPMNYNI